MSYLWIVPAWCTAWAAAAFLACAVGDGHETRWDRPAYVVMGLCLLAAGVASVLQVNA